jgi:3-oxoadipate enol-lactonase
MPITSSHPRLSYGLTGPEGAPVIALLSGLGGVQAGWAQQVRGLSDRWRVLTHDARGIGGSEGEARAVTVSDYAADLVRVMDHLAIASVHMVGLSFGGRVAQQFALSWPERLDRLVLGGTSCRTRAVGEVAPDALAALRDVAVLDAHGWETRLLPALFGEAYRSAHPKRIRALARWRARHRPKPEGIERQWQAYYGFDLSESVHRICHPTLILHGTDDGLSPGVNAVELSQKIPKARLVWMRDVGHAPNVERPRAFNAVVETFLLEGDLDAVLDAYRVQ